MKSVLGTFIILFGLVGNSFGQTNLCYKDLCIGMDEKEATSLLDGTHQSYLNKYEPYETLKLKECGDLLKSSKEMSSSTFDIKKYFEERYENCLKDISQRVVNEKYRLIGTLKTDKPKLKFLNGKLAEIFVRLSDVSDWEELRNALIDKWGKPDNTSKEEFQNRMGAKFYRISDLWIKKDGNIRYIINPVGGEEHVYYFLTSKQFADKEMIELRQRKSGIRKGL